MEVREWKDKYFELERREQATIREFESQIKSLVESYERQIDNMRKEKRVLQDIKNRPIYDQRRHKKDEKFDKMVFDLQNRITSLVSENEKLSMILKRYQKSSTDPLDNSLRKSLTGYKRNNYIMRRSRSPFAGNKH